MGGWGTRTRTRTKIANVRKTKNSGNRINSESKSLDQNKRQKLPWIPKVKIKTAAEKLLLLKRIVRNSKNTATTTTKSRMC
jgi:hypothetical protein